MKTPLLAIVVVSLASAVILPVSAHEWTAEQQEVWKNVETYWDLDAERDTDGFMEYFHEDYSGWSVDSPLPTGKSNVRKFIAHDHSTSERLVTHLQPAGVKIYGDIAIVHYYWTVIDEKKDGKEERDAGRWTDILKKQGSKWVLIADHGGSAGSGDD